MPVRIIATSFAFVAFATALLCGMAVSNPMGTVVGRACLAMLVCYLIGLAIGSIGRRAIQEHVDDYKKRYPVRPAGDDVQVINEEDLEMPDAVATENSTEPSPDAAKAAAS
jgi:hypothetical protein